MKLRELLEFAEDKKIIEEAMLLVEKSCPITSSADLSALSAAKKVFTRHKEEGKSVYSSDCMAQVNALYTKAKKAAAEAAANKKPAAAPAAPAKKKIGSAEALNAKNAAMAKCGKDATCKKKVKAKYGGA